jgi:hypothetical protein
MEFENAENVTTMKRRARRCRSYGANLYSRDGGYKYFAPTERFAFRNGRRPDHETVTGLCLAI